MAALLFRIEEASSGAVKVCRTAAEVRRSIATGVLAAILHVEGADADRPRVPPPRRALSGGVALSRPGVEPLECLRPRRPVPLSEHARHGAGAHRPRPRARADLQREADHARPLAPQRGRLLGGGSPQRRAARRDAFERPCADAPFAQSHRPPARGDPRQRRHGRRQLRRRVFCAPMDGRRRKRRSTT